MIEKNEGVRSIVIFSGDLDRLMAGINIAIAAVSMGLPVNMYFTFWGLNALRKENFNTKGYGLFEKLMAIMMPAGPKKLTLSKLNMGGLGTWMMKKQMKIKQITMLPELIKMAQEAGVRFIGCQMTMNMMGIKRDALIDGLHFTGVAGYLGEAEKSHFNLFI